MTLKEALVRNDGIGPGFHLLRHALATAIVLFHCRAAIYWSVSAATLAATHQVATGLTRESTWTLEDVVRPGIHSLVGMFFALSGFLVTGSALRTRLMRHFFVNRALRIIPALSVEVTLSALILGPIVTVLPLAAYFTDPMFFRYFGNIVGHITFYLPGVFETLPWPRIVNGNLWTLPAEFWCYAIIMAVMVLRLLPRRDLLLALLAGAMVAMLVAMQIDPVRYDVKGENMYTASYITFLFCAGGVAFLHADRIPLHWGLFLASGALYWASMFFGVLTPLSGIPLTYCMIFVGMTSFPLWDRWVKSDYSYGIYLYGFPIMQTYVWLLMPVFTGIALPLRLAILFPLTIVTTLAFAAVSWRWIEKPALGLRRKLFRAPALPAAPHPNEAAARA
ncbi:MAG: acyltransferase [Novosphingobium sp.]